ncbi:hypothetical protein DVA67_013475 [Solirubrobacter sp. CPCC 204708]|uniref:Calcium-binding protein n=1 Tax=Solirubrobacter deserti TaxID=2282478 RepID=A0ABT4RMN1_9ACTN|nr:calcium-binding protein [Solirubrobacter deserti]MBE2316987.1 hypothetical protein [Solirubrobacter deserti]MDA0139818.1 hypothetical protein [Solirubrobacter deserti]
MTVLRAALASVLLLLLPASAMAGGVRVDANGVIVVTGDVSGESIVVGWDGEDHYVESDRGLTVGGGDCTPDGSNHVDCTGTAFNVSFIGAGSFLDASQVSSSARLTATGSPGADELVGTPNDDTISGIEGDDSLWGGGGNDALNGGAGANTFNDGDGTDVSAGGPHNDTFNVGQGRDTLQPGDGYDVISYSTRLVGVTITLSGGADDGEPGEGDDVGAVAEQADGGSGNDVLAANNLGNTLNGGAGNDALIGGTAEDRLVGNEGDDSIDARDGRFDSVDCGPGNDVVFADPADLTQNCEVAPDADGDGYLANVDCAPTDPAIHPGAGEVIGNPVDEDCKDGPLYARVVSPVGYSIKREGSRNRMRFTKLTVGEIKPGDTIEIRCSTKARGCPFTRKTVTGKSKRTVSVLTHFKKRYLRRGAVVEIRTLRPNEIGSVRRLTVGRRGAVKSETLCLNVGASAPTRCA